MRTLGSAIIGAIAALCFVGGPGPATAQPVPLASKYGPLYPWCAQYGGGALGGGANCYFATHWQCQQAISGNGGLCYENPFYVAAVGTASAPARRVRHH
jgi:hypothetical protein